MRNISKISNCYGCGVCAIACPEKIISIHLNINGFYEPFITEKNKCIDCGLCLRVCSYNKEGVAEMPKFTKGTYAAWTRDNEVRRRCSSGGIGFEIGKYLIHNGYHICAVKYNPEMQRAEHYIARTINDFIHSVGSKYIQSYTFDGFSKLNKKDKFLVTGTPCQIDSLRNYIRIKRIEDNFVLMDFFCHGVPSMLMWHKYLLEVEKITGKATYVSWRNKETGWHDSWSMSVAAEKQDTVEYLSRLSQGDMFYRFFLTDRCLGKACYDKCKYKMFSSAADIRIGDLWGNAYKDNEEGVSGVVSFTAKGDLILENMKTIELLKEPDSIVAEGQMLASAKRPLGYLLTKYLMKTNISLKSIDNIIRTEYIIVNLPRLVINKLKRLLHKY